MMTDEMPIEEIRFAAAELHVFGSFSDYTRQALRDAAILYRLRCDDPDTELASEIAMWKTTFRYHGHVLHGHLSECGRLIIAELRRYRDTMRRLLTHRAS